MSASSPASTVMGNLPEVVDRDTWLAARLEHLAHEKELTGAHDRLAAERRGLPMVRIDTPYVFEGPDGEVTLLDLFEGREQLVVHHFMFHPSWEAACPSCSSAADGIGNLRQLHARRTSLVAISRAPYPQIAAYRERMGWTFPWVSSFGSTFNFDFHATLDDSVAPVLLHFRNEAELGRTGVPWTDQPWSPDLRGTEMPGVSVFLRVDDEIHLTYATFGRGIEAFHNGYPYLDLTALGRQEPWEHPRGRAVPLDRQVGGAGMRLPDEYDRPAEPAPRTCCIGTEPARPVGLGEVT